MGGFGNMSDIERKLFRYKKLISDLESKTQKEKGALETYYQQLSEVEGLSEEKTDKALVKKAQKLIDDLQITYDELQEEIESQLEDIQEQVDNWDDDDE